jgi:hypothetical protein
MLLSRKSSLSRSRAGNAAHSSESSRRASAGSGVRLGFGRSSAAAGLNWLGCACLLAGCASDPAPTLENGQTLEGELIVVQVEGHGRAAGLKRFLAHDGERTALSFERAPELRSGAHLSVHGQYRDGRFEVSDYARGSSVGVVREQLTGQAVQRSRTLTFVEVNLGGGITLPSGAADPASFMFSTSNAGPNCGLGAGKKSVVQFYNETSYNLFQFTGKVEGPFTYAGDVCSDTGDQMAAALSAEIPTKYDHYVWYYGSVQTASGCGYGNGSEGTWNSPSTGIWFNGDLFDGAIPHELGHNLGLLHASSIKCGAVPLADDPMTCTTDEYGDPVDIMGNLYTGHMIAPEKWYLGWFGGCNAVRVKGSGTFTLFPIETACNGIQALQIPMPKATRTFTTEQSDAPTPAKFYYLEYRQNTGLDTGIAPQVLVHVSDDIHGPDTFAARSVALDMKPGSDAVDGMQAGDSYADPAGGVSFKVISLDATKAVISVTLANGSGASTCMDGTALQGSGPDSCAGVANGGASGAGASGGAAGVAGGALGTGGANSAGGQNSAGASATNGGSSNAGNAAGSGGFGAQSGSGASGATSRAGSAGAPGVSPSHNADSSGCACRVGAPESKAPRAALSWWLLALALARTRRPRAASRPR